MSDDGRDDAVRWETVRKLRQAINEARDLASRRKADWQDARKGLAEAEAELDAYIEAQSRPLPLFDPPAMPDKKQEAKGVLFDGCRVCGCTEADCSGCVARTGSPCHWVEADLCSACVPVSTVSADPEEDARSSELAQPSMGAARLAAREKEQPAYQGASAETYSAEEEGERTTEDEARWKEEVHDPAEKAFRADGQLVRRLREGGAEAELHIAGLDAIAVAARWRFRAGKSGSFASTPWKRFIHQAEAANLWMGDAEGFFGPIAEDGHGAAAKDAGLLVQRIADMRAADVLALPLESHLQPVKMVGPGAPKPKKEKKKPIAEERPQDEIERLITKGEERYPDLFDAAPMLPGIASAAEQAAAILPPSPQEMMAERDARMKAMLLRMEREHPDALVILKEGAWWSFCGLRSIGWGLDLLKAKKNQFHERDLQAKVKRLLKAGRKVVVAEWKEDGAETVDAYACEEDKP